MLYVPWLGPSPIPGWQWLSIALDPVLWAPGPPLSHSFSFVEVSCLQLSCFLRLFSCCRSLGVQRSLFILYYLCQSLSKLAVLLVSQILHDPPSDKPRPSDVFEIKPLSMGFCWNGWGTRSFSLLGPRLLFFKYILHFPYYLLFPPLLKFYFIFSNFKLFILCWGIAN